MNPTRTILLLVAALALIAAGCGEGGSDDPGSPPGQATEGSTAGSAKEDGGGESRARESRDRSGKRIPPALAANRDQANEILDEGSLDRKLSQLEGFPIVVNQWASWCPPCRAEFPFLAASAEEHAAEVAFLGIDMQDSRDAAGQFLEENPVPYPSVFDPDASAIASLGGGVVSPTTAFIDEDGEVVHLFQGEYTSQEQLDADIERHLGVS